MRLFLKLILILMSGHTLYRPYMCVHYLQRRSFGMRMVMRLYPNQSNLCCTHKNIGFHNLKVCYVLHKATSSYDLASLEFKCSPFKIPLIVITQQCLQMVDALIDQDKSLNVLSWEMWNALGQLKLSPKNLGFIKFSQTKTTYLGCICLKLHIQGELIYILFYVANKRNILESVILGRNWMRSTKCQQDWENYTYTIEVNSQTLTGSRFDTIQDLLNEK